MHFNAHIYYCASLRQVVHQRHGTSSHCTTFCIELWQKLELAALNTTSCEFHAYVYVSVCLVRYKFSYKISALQLTYICMMCIHAPRIVCLPSTVPDPKRLTINRITCACTHTHTHMNSYLDMTTILFFTFHSN